MFTDVTCVLTDATCVHHVTILSTEVTSGFPVAVWSIEATTGFPVTVWSTYMWSQIVNSIKRFLVHKVQSACSAHSSLVYTVQSARFEIDTDESAHYVVDTVVDKILWWA